MSAFKANVPPTPPSLLRRMRRTGSNRDATWLRELRAATRPACKVRSRPRGREHLTAVWEIFRRKRREPQKVTTGRFEIERNGKVAYLEYSLSGNILELTHTEIPEKLRHMGLASSLAETALHWAREHNLKVDVICPTVQQYVTKHPEHSDLVLH